MKHHLLSSLNNPLSLLNLRCRLNLQARHRLSHLLLKHRQLSRLNNRHSLLNLRCHLSLQRQQRLSHL
jgi:hypothetical protein